MAYFPSNGRDAVTDAVVMQWLDPTLDVVFKMLFAHARNRDILISLLTAILKPAAPIDFVEVLNPDIPKDLPADKGAVLDIHVRLADGRHVDVEMQSQAHTGLAKRVLYYWARLHATQLTRGDLYEKLYPTVSILILNEPLLPLPKAHSTFRVLEVEAHHEFSNELEIHCVELSKVALQHCDASLERWMRLLLARRQEQFEELAMTDPNIRRAVEALGALSQDPEAQELARQREMAQINLKIIKQFEREEGEARGEAKGRAEGEAKALRVAVQAICDVLGIELDVNRQEALEQLDAVGLTALLEHLRTNRQWP